ncbi:MAG: RNA polymerase sigma factor [SAR202 cluster bacterium]|nr:RNA polymerase sigma factor [SAR202 cluster bacterium]
MLDDTQVIAQVRTGQTDAFGHIVERYQLPIVRYLTRLTGNIETARDLAQDTFLQAYKSILKTKSELSLKAWLYRIATNNARQFHRRRRLLTFVPFGERGTPVIAADQASSEQTVERMTIEQAMLRVNHERRVCMVLHYVEGLKYKEIGEIVGVSEEAVRKRVARGNNDFRKAYQSLSGDREE